MYVYSKDGTLYHHGIKGMKWGRRRFQYKDGSLTPAGEKRYDDPNDSSSGKRKGQNTAASKGDAAQIEARKKKIKKAAIIGAAAVGTALAAYGGYRISKMIKEKKAIRGRQAANARLFETLQSAAKLAEDPSSPYYIPADKIVSRSIRVGM